MLTVAGLPLSSKRASPVVPGLPGGFVLYRDGVPVRSSGYRGALGRLYARASSRYPGSVFRLAFVPG